MNATVGQVFLYTGDPGTSVSFSCYALNWSSIYLVWLLVSIGPLQIGPNADYTYRVTLLPNFNFTLEIHQNYSQQPFITQFHGSLNNGQSLYDQTGMFVLYSEGLSFVQKRQSIELFE